MLDEVLKCPRCRATLGTELYGPCPECRAQLRRWSDELGIEVKRKHEEWLRKKRLEDEGIEDD